MRDYFPTLLSATDYSRLQNLMRGMIGSRSPLAALVRHKLGTARVIPDANTRGDLVSGGRKVRVRIGRGRSDERVLVWGPFCPTDELSLLTPDGLALLGLSTGQHISFEGDDRRTKTFLIEDIMDDRTRLSRVAAENADRPRRTVRSPSQTGSLPESASETVN